MQSVTFIAAGALLSFTTLISIRAQTSPLPTPQTLGNAQASSADALAAARKLINEGHPEQALTQLDPIERTQPHTPGLERMRGNALYSLGQLERASAAYATAIQENPHDQEAMQMRGLTLFRLGRAADAIPLLEGASSFGAQTKADPSYVLALCYMDTRRYDDARHAFAAQYGFAPDSAEAYLITARMLLRREFVPVAEQFATHAMQLNPSLPQAHALLGEIALAQSRLPDAITDFEEEIRADPLDGNAYERLGDAYNRAARYSDADRILQQAILLEPNATGPYLLLGKAKLKLGDPVAAMTYLQRAEKMDPANYITHNLLAQTYRALGREADATREFQATEKIQAADSPKVQTPQ